MKKRKEPMRKIIAILGKASAGKDTLATMLQDTMDFPMALSFTTRPMRATEEQGVEYNFISKDKFDWLDDCGYLAEYTSYNVANGDTWYYGLTKRELEKDQYVIVIVNPDGLRQLKEIYGNKIFSVLIDADAKIRIDRYLSRDIADEVKVEECCRRFLADQEDFRNIRTDYTVYNNGDTKDAFKSLQDVVRRVVSLDILKKVNNDFRNDPASFVGDKRC